MTDNSVHARFVGARIARQGMNHYLFPFINPCASTLSANNWRRLFIFGGRPQGSRPTVLGNVSIVGDGFPIPCPLTLVALPFIQNRVRNRIGASPATFIYNRRTAARFYSLFSAGKRRHSVRRRCKTSRCPTVLGNVSIVGDGFPVPCPLTLAALPFIQNRVRNRIGE